LTPNSGFCYYSLHSTEQKKRLPPLFGEINIGSIAEPARFSHAPLSGVALFRRSENINFRTLIAGLLMQVCLALILLKFPGSQDVFLWLNKGVQALEESTKAGTGFVFGYLGGGPLPF
jgi:hypothetical protein